MKLNILNAAITAALTTLVMWFVIGDQYITLTIIALISFLGKFVANIILPFSSSSNKNKKTEPGKRQQNSG